MSMYLPFLEIFRSRFSNKCRPQAGFTLVELLVTFAIITIVSSVILVRFNTFDSVVVHDAVAFQVLSTVREAQVFAASTIEGSADFRNAYGVHFVKGSNQFVLFEDTELHSFNPGGRTEFTAGDNVLQTYTLADGFVVSRIDARNKGGNFVPGHTGFDDLDFMTISFIRPVLQTRYDGSGTDANDRNIGSALISIENSSGEVRVVEVVKSGQMFVQ